MQMTVPACVMSSYPPRDGLQEAGACEASDARWRKSASGVERQRRGRQRAARRNVRCIWGVPLERSARASADPHLRSLIFPPLNLLWKPGFSVLRRVTPLSLSSYHYCWRKVTVTSRAPCRALGLLGRDVGKNGAGNRCVVPFAVERDTIVDKVLLQWMARDSEVCMQLY